MIYESFRKFKVWGYTVSHGSLLLRSEMRFNDQSDFSEDTSYNIDIEFWAVTFMSIPTFLTSLIIKEIECDLLPKHIDRSVCEFNHKIFEIQEGDKKHYIVSGGFLVGTNKWANEDRIFNYNSGLQHDAVLVVIK